MKQREEKNIKKSNKNKMLVSLKWTCWLLCCLHNMLDSWKFIEIRLRHSFYYFIHGFVTHTQISQTQQCTQSRMGFYTTLIIKLVKVVIMAFLFYFKWWTFSIECYIEDFVVYANFCPNSAWERRINDEHRLDQEKTTWFLINCLNLFRRDNQIELFLFCF